ncbi:MAG: c-type cytochrome [Acidobacteriota bacterium]
MIRALPFLGAAVLAALLSAAALSALDRYAAYHSPLHGPGPGWTPRLQGLEDLREWRARRAAEALRRAELLRELTTERMVELGREIVHGRGLCFNCHRIGDVGTGEQGPNLEGVGAAAGSRRPGLSDVEYLAQSLYRPEAFVVPGFSPAMPPANGPPIGLDDLEIAMVIAYLQSLGGTPSIAPDTRLPYGADGTAPAD